MDTRSIVVATVMLICISAGSAFASELIHTTPFLSEGRFYLSATTVGSTAFFAGGVHMEPGCCWRFHGLVDVYYADTDAWATAMLSEPRAFLAATTVGSKAIFAGGCDSLPSFIDAVYSDAVDIYDADTDRWTTATLSTPRAHLAATSVGGKAFFAGGHDQDASDVVDIYDTVTDTWTTASLSAPRQWLAATTVGSKAMFAGGDDEGYSDVVDIYDNDTGLWTTATLSEARRGLAATTVGSKAIFTGGTFRTGGSWGYEGSDAFSDVVDIYDDDTGLWSTTVLPSAFVDLAATTLGSKALFAGYKDLVDIYDVDAGLWSTAAFSQRRMYPSATTVGNKAIFAGGKGPGSAHIYGSGAVDIYIETFPADLNDDGFVGPADLDVVLGQWGNSGVDITDPRADINADDFVGQGDLDHILADWGRGTSAPVPEPATLSLMGMASLAVSVHAF